MLSEWILQSKGLFEQKRVLELGSGIGLSGLIVSKECSPESVYLTDCHESVLDLLCENVKLNVNEIIANNSFSQLDKR